MSRITVEIVFEGQPADVRDTAQAFVDGLRSAQRAGRFPDVELVAGPTLTQGSKPGYMTVREAVEAAGLEWRES